MSWLFCFQPDVSRIVLWPELNRGLSFVIYWKVYVGNSFGSLSVLCQANTDIKNWYNQTKNQRKQKFSQKQNKTKIHFPFLAPLLPRPLKDEFRLVWDRVPIPVLQSESGIKRRLTNWVLSLALPSLSSSSASSLLLSLLQLDASHWYHPDHRVLVELALAVHQTVSLGSLDPHPLVHLPRHRRLERSKHLHWKIYMLAFMFQHAVFPKRVVRLLQPQPIFLLLASAISIAPSLSLVLCSALLTANSVARSVSLAIASPNCLSEGVPCGTYV